MSEKFYYRLTQRGHEVTSEIVCLEHYAYASQPGRDMGPLSVREQAAGYRQTVIPYKGDRDCATCNEIDNRHSEQGELQSERRLQP